MAVYVQLNRHRNMNVYVCRILPEEIAQLVWATRAIRIHARTMVYAILTMTDHLIVFAFVSLSLVSHIE